MTILKYLACALALGLQTPPVAASDVMIQDPYFRTSGPSAKSGGAFMHIANHTSSDDRLISVRSDVAARVEMHRNIDGGEGVIQMRRAVDGFEIPAQGMHILARGGDHLMFMGLTRKVVDGDMIAVIFSFEKAGEIGVEIPVDQNRKPGGHADSGSHNHDG